MPGGGPQFAGGPPEKSDHPTLSGTVDGRPVRARTYTTSGENQSSTTFTVVEAELDTAVDWHASFGTPHTPQGSDDHPVGAANLQTVDGVGVRGDVSEELVREVLTPEVTDAVARVEGEVSVGNVTDNLMSDALDALDGDAGGDRRHGRRGDVEYGGGRTRGPLSGRRTPEQ